MDWENVQRLIDVQERLASDFEEMVTIVMTELHEEPYTLDEVHIVINKKEPRFFFRTVSQRESMNLRRNC